MLIDKNEVGKETTNMNTNYEHILNTSFHSVFKTTLWEMYCYSYLVRSRQKFRVGE